MPTPCQTALKMYHNTGFRLLQAYTMFEKVGLLLSQPYPFKPPLVCRHLIVKYFFPPLNVHFHLIYLAAHPAPLLPVVHRDRWEIHTPQKSRCVRVPGKRSPCSQYKTGYGF